MKAKILIFFLALISFSCLEEETPMPAFPEGTYTGQFFRTGPLILTEPSDVTLVLTAGAFSGTSEKRSFPAIGTGKFSVSGNSVTFKNESFFTADFDWSLILDGTFTLSHDGDFLILTKKQGDVTDTYKLKKQVSQK